MNEAVTYPEHEKLKALDGASQTTGLFLDWLMGKYVLAQWVDTGRREEELLPARCSIQDLLAEYFGIDQTKLENEKRAMLEAIGSSPQR